jgi:hypothetical protein
LSSALALAARQQKQANKEAKQQQAFKGIVVAGGRPRAGLRRRPTTAYSRSY